MNRQTPPPPVARLDPALSLKLLNESAGTAIEMVGPAPGGAVGAAFVRWPDGRDGVLTRGPNDLTHLELASGILDQAREFGIPCPTYDLVHRVADSVIIIQQRLPGAPPAQVDDRLVASMIDLNDRFADVLIDRRDVPLLDLYLDRSGSGF
jgi:hypothetical protein